MAPGLDGRLEEIARGNVAASMNIVNMNELAQGLKNNMMFP